MQLSKIVHTAFVIRCRYGKRFLAGAILDIVVQIKDMSDRDLARYWSNYVKEIAVLLVSVEGDPSPPQGIVARIQELVQKELLFLYIRQIRVSPTLAEGRQHPP